MVLIEQIDELQDRAWLYLADLTEKLLHPIHMYLMSLIPKEPQNRLEPRPILGELVRFEDFFDFLQRSDLSLGVPFRPSLSSSLLNLLSSGKKSFNRLISYF